jgi:predicted XRE-type DNA-binding protein
LRREPAKPAKVIFNCAETPETHPTVMTREPTMPTRHRRTTGNVFADLGFPREEAEHLKMRSNLMIELTKLIRNSGLTQSRAARLFGVSQPRVSDLTRGRIERFSIDTLVEMLGHAGVRVLFKMQRTRHVA